MPPGQEGTPPCPRMLGCGGPAGGQAPPLCQPRPWHLLVGPFGFTPPHSPTPGAKAQSQPLLGRAWELPLSKYQLDVVAWQPCRTLGAEACLDGAVGLAVTIQREPLSPGRWDSTGKFLLLFFRKLGIPGSRKG